jgi:hypothetical protein
MVGGAVLIPKSIDSILCLDKLRFHISPDRVLGCIFLNKKTPAEAVVHLVAGVGFEPTTFGL